MSYISTAKAWDKLPSFIDRIISHYYDLFAVLSWPDLELKSV